MRAVLLTCVFFILGTSAFAAANADVAASDELTKQLDDAPAVFASVDDFPDQLNRLMELESQVLQLAQDEPLKLGSLGSAILDIYPASLTGHYAMRLFYEHLHTEDARTSHDQALTYLADTMSSKGDGSPESPYPIMTVNDAHAYLLIKGLSPVGSMYRFEDSTPLGYLLIGKPEAGLLTRTSFSLDHLLDNLEVKSTGNAREARRLKALSLVRLFAAQMDSAAQTSIGAYLAGMQKHDQAIGWLKAAARTSNILANGILARVYLAKAEDAEDPADIADFKDQALENFMHAIALGSTDSMYTLGNLYISDYYGEENRGAAVALFQQAAELGHSQSQLYLGHLFSTGREVEKDTATANEYFTQAAANNDARAILSYGRFLSANHSETADPRVIDWLERLAKDDNSEAMVVLGNLHARGIATSRSTGRAVRWYKRAVKQDPRDADVVNEVAWTLTVSDVDGLKRTRYARRIMDDLMQADDAPTDRPEYLDTWAATCAATGDFDLAIQLQQQAIVAATDQRRDDVMDILQEHLEHFEAGNSITEPAP